MKKMLLFAVIVFSNSVAFGNCFISSDKTMADAQSLRKEAQKMNWELGKTASIVAASFIKGKILLYPQDEMEVCLQESATEGLVFKVQSQSSDAGSAKWRKIYAHKTK